MKRLFILPFLAFFNTCFLFDNEEKTAKCKVRMHLGIVNNDSSELYFTVAGIPDRGPNDGYNISTRYLFVQAGDTAIDTIERTWESSSRCTCSSVTPFVTLMGNTVENHWVEIFLRDSLRGFEDGFKSDSLNIVYKTIVFPKIQ